MEFSAPQLNVINQEKANILVSAAAGSGKTTVLVERIVSRILSGKLDVSQVLVVTFTRDAASNMRMKLEEALHGRLGSADREEADFIKDQLDRLPGAYIQTMDSFCARVLDESSYLAGGTLNIEPGSYVIDDNTRKILWKDAAGKAVSSQYIKIAAGLMDERSRDDFLALTYSLGDGKQDATLAESLCEIYDTLRSLPGYLDLIKEDVKAREADDEEGIIIGEDYLIEENVNLLRKACEYSHKIQDLSSISEDFKKIAAAVSGALSDFESKLGSFDSLKFDEKLEVIKDAHDNFASLTGLKFPKIPKDDPALCKLMGPIAALIVMHKAELGINRMPGGYNDASEPFKLNPELKQFSGLTSSDLLKRQKRRTSCARAACELLSILDGFYAEMKRRLNGMDYADLEHMCLKAFDIEEIKQIYKTGFKEIYIDEYQDNTALQDAIISKIADNNVFCVGDVKQSIYRFRHARPAMFIDKSKRYGAGDGGVLCELNNNFRSSPQVLSFVNELFAQLMSADASEIAYTADHHELNPGPMNPEGPVPQVVLINSKDSFKDEVSGKKISADRLLAIKTVLQVKKYLETYEEKDIYILTRTRSMASGIAGMLKTAGINARSLERREVFADNEIVGMCNLIMVMANENRDECFAGVMLAPYRFSNFTPDELAEICSFDPALRKLNLVVKVHEYARRGGNEEIKSRCITLLDALDFLRSESVIRDIGELMELIFAKTGIRATAMMSSQEEVNKLSVFKKWICDSFLGRRCDISDVAASVEDIRGKIGDKAEIEFEDYGDNFVRCMTYHKSKGLENKCVIVVDTDSQGGNSGPTFLGFCDGAGGTGFVISDYDEDTGVPSDSLEKLEASEFECLDGNSENIRLLYVALTRAKENLMLMRAVNLDDAKALTLMDDLALEPRELSRKFYLKHHTTKELIVSSTARVKGGEGSSDLKLLTGFQGDFSWKSDFDGFTLEVNTAEDLLDVDLTEGDRGEEDGKLKESDLVFIFGVKEFDEDGIPIFGDYEFDDSVNTAAKTSVSALKQSVEGIYDRGGEDVFKEASGVRSAINLQVRDAQDYVASEGKLSASERGTALHTVMHFIDLDAAREGDVKSLLEDLCREEIINEDELEAVLMYAPHIKAFAESKIGRALASAIDSGKAMLERPIECAVRINPSRSDYSLIQGVIDAMYIEDDGAVIIDYKTDNIKTNDPDEIKKIVSERHKTQLDLYAAAVEKSGIHVKGKYIWLMRKDIRIEL